jgi:quinol monooxygenase YgiN
MIAKHSVEEFDQWKMIYDGDGAAIRAQGGVIAHRVHRDLDDPHWVTVCHQFGDEQTARAYAAMLGGEEFLALAEQTGIDLDSVEVSLLADVD